MNTDAANDAVLDKIRKLLRLSKSPNKHEAELALQRAAEIAAKHHLDLSQVKDEDCEFGGIKLPLPTRGVTVCDEFATWIVSEFFHVLCVEQAYESRNCQMLFYGKKADCEVAVFVFSFLCEEAERRWKEFRAAQTEPVELDLFMRTPRKSAAHRDSYLAGFFAGLHDKLSEAVSAALPEEYGLILRSDRERLKTHLQKHIRLQEAVSRKIKVEDRASVEAGYSHGQETHIRKGLSQKAA